MKRKNILFLLTGSIAAYKACEVISRLVQKGFAVQTVATQNALKFVGAPTLEGLSGFPVFSDIYESGRQMDHIQLVRNADLALLCPASANTINQMAAGLGESAVTTTYLAWDFSKPFLVAPAMNQAMYLHPATQRSLKTIKKDGVVVLPAGDGRQACGDVGPGRLLEPEEITAFVLNYFSQPEVTL